MTAAGERRSVRRKCFVLLYAASGAAALVYEIVWTRLLTVTLGHTVAAASTVLAALMGGFALGAWLGGRLEQSLSRRPAINASRSRLHAYAAMETVTALCAYLLPTVLAASVPLLKWAYHDGFAPTQFGLVRLIVSITAVIVPATAMGATFPIAASWLPAHPAKQSRRSPRLDGVTDAGILYASNTAGAAAGALVAGLWLIPSIGMRATSWVGITINIVAATGAVVLSRVAESPGVIADAEAGPPNVTKKNVRRSMRVQRTAVPMPATACATIAVSGFVALIYEVAWTRLLALVVGPTTYAFTIVVVSFIVGIAIGSAAGSWLAARSPQPILWLAAMLAVTAVAASLAGWFAASRLPLLVAAAVANPSALFGRVVAGEALGIGALLLPMTCALGAAFPLALAAGTVSLPTIGRDCARVYAWNTLGGIAGALTGGFILLPRLGLQGAFMAAETIGLVAAAVALMTTVHFERVWRRAATAAVLAACGSAVFLLPRWQHGVLAGGAYKYAGYLHPADLEVELRAWKFLFYKDGASATVAVRELAGMRSLVIDGKVDASNTGDMLTQRMLGLLPVLLHPNPQEVCVIGLGSGVTADSALAAASVRAIDVVEVSPEVVTASAFFAQDNRHVLSRPGVRVILGDGRSHLRLTKQRYDVIVSEPSNPWMAGVASLFTREFFQEARTCLKPHGVICQWAHTYGMREDDLKSIARTFASVFPESSMWLVGDGDLLLIGSADEELDLREIAKRTEEQRVRAVLQDIAVDDRAAAFAILSTLVGGPALMKVYAGEAAIQHDDRMALEYSAPRAIYGRPVTDNARTIRMLAGAGGISPLAGAALPSQPTDVSWTVAGRMELKANAFQEAYDRFERALRINSRNAEALAGLSDAAAGSGRQEEALASLESLRAADPANANVRIEISRLLSAAGDVEAASAAAAEAMRIHPAEPRAAEQLASVLADAGDANRLAPVAAALAARFPNRGASHYYQATALFLKGRPQDAIDEVRLVLAQSPQDARAQNLLGVVCATMAKPDCALAAFAAAAAASPRDPTAYVNRGIFRMQSANPAQAVDEFSVALTLDSTSAAARRGLADARAALAEGR